METWFEGDSSNLLFVFGVTYFGGVLCFSISLLMFTAFDENFFKVRKDMKISKRTKGSLS